MCPANFSFAFAGEDAVDGEVDEGEGGARQEAAGGGLQAAPKTGGRVTVPTEVLASKLWLKSFTNMLQSFGDLNIF